MHDLIPMPASSSLTAIEAEAVLEPGRDQDRVIADPTIVDAVLDRVVHRAHRIELKGPSLRSATPSMRQPKATVERLPDDDRSQPIPLQCVT